MNKTQKIIGLILITLAILCGIATTVEKFLFHRPLMVTFSTIGVIASLLVDSLALSVLNKQDQSLLDKESMELSFPWKMSARTALHMFPWLGVVILSGLVWYISKKWKYMIVTLALDKEIFYSFILALVLLSILLFILYKMRIRAAQQNISENKNLQ